MNVRSSMKFAQLCVLLLMVFVQMGAVPTHAQSDSGVKPLHIQQNGDGSFSVIVPIDEWAPTAQEAVISYFANTEPIVSPIEWDEYDGAYKIATFTPPEGNEGFVVFVNSWAAQHAGAWNFELVELEGTRDSYAGGLTSVDLAIGESLPSIGNYVDLIYASDEGGQNRLGWSCSNGGDPSCTATASFESYQAYVNTLVSAAVIEDDKRVVYFSMFDVDHTDEGEHVSPICGDHPNMDISLRSNEPDLLHRWWFDVGVDDGYLPEVNARGEIMVGFGSSLTGGYDYHIIPPAWTYDDATQKWWAGYAFFAQPDAALFGITTDGLMDSGGVMCEVWGATATYASIPTVVDNRSGDKMSFNMLSPAYGVGENSVNAVTHGSIHDLAGGIINEPVIDGFIWDCGEGDGNKCTGFLSWETPREWVSLWTVDFHEFSGILFVGHDQWREQAPTPDINIYLPLVVRP